MAILFVTYDLRKQGKDYTDVLKTIKTYDYAELSESAYVIDTTDNASVVFNKLRPYIDADDYLFITPLTRPYFGQGARVAIDWLQQHLPQ